MHSADGFLIKVIHYEFEVLFCSALLIMLKMSQFFNECHCL